MDYDNLPKLDRIPRFDERSRAFAAVECIDASHLVSNLWECLKYFNQGQEGACVGHGWAHELAAEPDVVEVTQQDCFDIYHRAQQIDDWPGEDYSGTSVLAGVKAVQERKTAAGLPLIGEYRWAFGIEDVVKTIGHLGPVVFGIQWHNNMYRPNEQGWIALGGGVVGGHCILGTGVTLFDANGEQREFDNYADIDVHKSFITLHNSWGTDYGDGGNAYISLYDVDYLLKQQGEACIPTIRNI